MMDKLEDTLDKLLKARINEEAVSIERVHFYKTDRKVNPKREKPFKLFTGNIPVLVSAPHTVRYIKQKKIKKSDEYTGAIAYLLNRLAGCHSLVVTKLYGGDPNYDNPCIYKNYLAEICQQHNIKLILDINGAARKYSFDVDLATGSGKTLLNKVKILPEIINNFNKAGLSRISQDYFRAAETNTITRFAAQELKIPSMQLKINRKYRSPAQNSQGFCRLMAALSSIIES